MTTPFKAACVQLNAGNDLAANLAAAGAGIRMAVTQGATFILTPEYCVMMDGSGRTMRERAQAPDGGEALAAFRGFARETGAWLLAGSLTCRGGDADPDRIVNRSFLLRPDGEVAASGPPQQVLTEATLSRYYRATVRVLHDGDRLIVVPTRGTGSEGPRPGDRAARREGA